MSTRRANSSFRSGNLILERSSNLVSARPNAPIFLGYPAACSMLATVSARATESSQLVSNTCPATGLGSVCPNMSTRLDTLRKTLAITARRCAAPATGSARPGRNNKLPGNATTSRSSNRCSRMLKSSGSDFCSPPNNTSEIGQIYCARTIDQANISSCLGLILFLCLRIQAFRQAFYHGLPIALLHAVSGVHHHKERKNKRYQICESNQPDCPCSSSRG